MISKIVVTKVLGLVLLVFAGSGLLGCASGLGIPRASSIASHTAHFIPASQLQSQARKSVSSASPKKNKREQLQADMTEGHWF